MKILILGARGNLGQQLVKVFKDDCEVVVCGIKELDITDKELIFKKFKEVKSDIIINAAAYNAVDRCEEDEKEFELAKKINGEAPGVLAQAALENDAVLIHYSSDYVFGKDTNKTNRERIKRIKEQGGFKENDEPCSVNKYGETKLMGENEILKYKNQGLKYYIIRASKLFGPIGKSKQAKQSFFDIMLTLAESKKELDVVDEEVSCFTYTADLAKATKELIENKKSYGLYHIANSGPCAWYEAAKELFKIAGVNVKVNPVASDKFPRPAKRPKYSVLLNTKLDNLRDYKEALMEYLLTLNKEL